MFPVTTPPPHRDPRGRHQNGHPQPHADAYPPRLALVDVAALVLRVEEFLHPRRAHDELVRRGPRGVEVARGVLAGLPVSRAGLPEADHVAHAGVHVPYRLGVADVAAVAAAAPAVPDGRAPQFGNQLADDSCGVENNLRLRRVCGWFAMR